MAGASRVVCATLPAVQVQYALDCESCDPGWVVELRSCITYTGCVLHSCAMGSGAVYVCVVITEMFCPFHSPLFP